MIVAAHSRAQFAGAARIAGALTLVLIVASLGLFSAVAAQTSVPDPTPAIEELSGHEWEALWTSVLMRRVDDAGRIDFAALAQDHADLDRVVAFVAAVDPTSRPQRFADRTARLAFYINAYNALAMSGIVGGPPWRNGAFHCLPIVECLGRIRRLGLRHAGRLVQPLRAAGGALARRA